MTNAEEKKKYPQIWPRLSEETYAELSNLAGKENRKVSDMAKILIESALKERKRKRKNAKEEGA